MSELTYLIDINGSLVWKSKEWILERWGCFGSFDSDNNECTLFCLHINKWCKLEKERIDKNE